MIAACFLLALVAASQAIPYGYGINGLTTTGIYGHGIGYNNVALNTGVYGTGLGYGMGLGYGTGMGYAHGYLPSYNAAAAIGPGLTAWPATAWNGAAWGAGYPAAATWGAGYGYPPGIAAAGYYPAAAYPYTAAALGTYGMGYGMTGYGMGYGMTGYGMPGYNMGMHHLGYGINGIWKRK